MGRVGSRAACGASRLYGKGTYRHRHPSRGPGKYDRPSTRNRQPYVALSNRLERCQLQDTSQPAPRPVEFVRSICGALVDQSTTLAASTSRCCPTIPERVSPLLVRLADQSAQSCTESRLNREPDCDRRCESAGVARSNSQCSPLGQGLGLVALCRPGEPAHCRAVGARRPPRHSRRYRAGQNCRQAL